MKLCFFILIFCLIGCTKKNDMPNMGSVSNFTLEDSEGKPFTLEKLKGKVWVASFIYTRCQEQCPMIFSQLKRLQEKFSPSPQFQLVSFTVDPTYDTKEVLNRYKKEKKMEGNWALVTGSPDVLGKLFFDSFHVAAIPMKEGSKAENMTHSSHLIAVDGKGQIRGYFDAMDETKTNDLNALLKSLLRGN